MGRVIESSSRLFCILFSGLALGTLAQADTGVTYHGRLLKPDGEPVLSSAVHFRVQIRTPISTNCLMYEETQVKDLSVSNGTFSIVLNDGNAIVPNVEPFSLDRVFQNRGTFSFVAGKCAVGNSYAPGPFDGRVLAVSFNDGDFGGWEPLPPQAISFVPTALEAVTVGGYRGGQLFKVDDGALIPPDIAPWSSANYQKLVDLVAHATVSGGVVSVSGTAAGFTGSLAGDVTGGQSSTKVTGLQGRAVLDTPPSNGQVLTWNHAFARWEPVTMSLSGSASGDLTGNYPNPTIADHAVSGDKIADGGVAFVKIAAGSATGQVLRYDALASTWSATKLHFMDLVNDIGASPWPSGSCSLGEAIVWQSITDGFSCVAISLNALLPSQSGQSGKILQTDGTNVSWALPASGDHGALTGLGDDDHAQYALLAGRVGGQSLVGGTAANNHLTLESTSAGTKGHVLLQPNGGNVGIGTTTPQSKLDVSGTIRAEEICDETGANCKDVSSGWGSGASSLAGDVSGVFGATTVDAIKGKSVVPVVYSAGQVLRYDGTNWVNALVNLSTDVTGTLPLASTSGTLPISRGGTGAVLQSDAINNLLPSQSSNAGKILQTDGTDVSWADAPVTGITALTGDVTASGAGSVAAAIANSAVTNSKLAANAVDSAKIQDGTISGVDMDFTGVNGATSSFVMRNPSGSFHNFTCVTAGHVPTWTAAGFTCQVPTAVETDPKVGANTLNFLGKWDGSALVKSELYESGGDLGLGTTTPAHSLDIRRIAGDTSVSLFGPDTGQQYIQFGNSLIRRWSIGTDGVGRLFFYHDYTDGTGTAGQSMVMDNSGHVGINVLNPASTLHVASDSQDTRIRIQADPSRTAMLDFLSGTGVLWSMATQNNYDGNALLFQADAITRMVVTPTGNVGIGTSTPTATLDVAGEVKVGATAASCDASMEGALRYNSAQKAMEFCNGLSWQLVNSLGFVGGLTMRGASSCKWATSSTGWVRHTTSQPACPAATLEGAATAPSEGKIPGIRFPSLMAGRYKVTFTVQVVDNTTNALGCFFRIADGTGTSVPIMVEAQSSWQEYTLMGDFNYAVNQGPTTYYIESRRDPGTGTGSCDVMVDATDFDMRVIVEKIK